MAAELCFVATRRLPAQNSGSASEPRCRPPCKQRLLRTGSLRLECSRVDFVKSGGRMQIALQRAQTRWTKLPEACGCSLAWAPRLQRRASRRRPGRTMSYTGALCPDAAASLCFGGRLTGSFVRPKVENIPKQQQERTTRKKQETSTPGEAKDTNTNIRRRSRQRVE